MAAVPVQFGTPWRATSGRKWAVRPPHLDPCRVDDAQTLVALNESERPMAASNRW